MVCEDVHKLGDEKCKGLKPQTVKLRQGDVMACDDCNERRFGKSETSRRFPPVRTSMAHALLAASPIKIMNPRTFGQVVSLPPTTPVRGPPSPIEMVAGPSTVDTTMDTTVTAPVLKCIEGCNNIREKAKPVECLLCCEQFHKTCVGLKASSRPSAWICESCKNIPRTVKLLTKVTEANKKEISNLKNENATLTQLVNEQRTLIEELQSQKCKPTELNKKNDKADTRDARTGTLLIGDSIIKDINEAGLENATVKCIRGAKTSDIAAEIKTPETYEAVIIHSGTNDCTNDDDVQQAQTTFNNMIKDIRVKAPDTQILISTVCPRNDDDGIHQERVDRLNQHIKNVVGKTDKCEVIDNDGNFKLRNNDADEHALNGSKLHLSKQGTRKLLGNLNSKRKIVKPSSRPAQTKRKDIPKNDHVRERRDGMKNKRGCYNCGERNHQRKDCKHGKPVKCFSCGGLGHKQHMDLCK